MSLSVREHTKEVVWLSTLSWLIQSLSAKTGVGNDGDLFQPHKQVFLACKYKWMVYKRSWFANPNLFDFPLVACLLECRLKAFY